MSEARALTNVIGNGVATLVVARWCHDLDRDQLQRELTSGPEARPSP
jgi:aerobic C4-dicarboxylate transport protein